MPDRKFLTCHPTSFDIVKKEVARRNKKVPAGERGATMQQVTDEIILQWKEDEKAGINKLKEALNES